MIKHICKNILIVILISLPALIGAQTIAPERLSSRLVEFEIKTGERASDFFKRLEADGIVTVDSIEAQLETAYFARKLAIVPDSVKGLRKLEGILIPQHYTAEMYGDNESIHARTILTHLLQASEERLRTVQGNDFMSPYEMLILTSIVEKEAAFNIQYKETADALWTRQKLFKQTGRFEYRLGCCSTVEYVLGFHRPFLLKSDIRSMAESPYNTYVRAGLPPTPIAFFSEHALNAVKNAELTNRTFFVMDWLEGRLYFNEHWIDHDAVAKNIVARIKSRYGGLVHQKMQNNYYNYFSNLAAESAQPVLVQKSVAPADLNAALTQIQLPLLSQLQLLNNSSAENLSLAE